MFQRAQYESPQADQSSYLAIQIAQALLISDATENSDKTAQTISGVTLTSSI